MIGHLLDATETYLAGFAIVRDGGAPPEPVGVAGMATASDEAARRYRSVGHQELLARFRDASEALVHELEVLSDPEWTGLLVPDAYLGPLPAMIIATGLLAGTTVHGWDILEGLGARHTLAGDVADFVVPFVYVLWRATADTSSVEAPYAIGIRTTGLNGGDTRFDISERGLDYAAADLEGCPTVIELDPGTLVLTAYNRVNAGTVRGDPRLATRFRELFVSI